MSWEKIYVAISRGEHWLIGGAIADTEWWNTPDVLLFPVQPDVFERYYLGDAGPPKQDEVELIPMEYAWALIHGQQYEDDQRRAES